MPTLKIVLGLTLVPLLLFSGATAQEAPRRPGIRVRYQLPPDGPLPRTYRVTLAIVDPKNPDWIISQFAAGVPRTVTADNQGKFAETWDGLDDNFMPVPPGDYAVKGICMEARPWKVDGGLHSVTPRFVGGASSWMPRPEDWSRPEPFGGDPCGAPLRDVDVGADGHAVFYYEYLENGTNNPVLDLRKPVGPDQFVRAYGSGGAGGGTSTCTDGSTVWSFSTDGGPKYVYRADGRPFGTDRAQRNNVYRPEGWVTAMAAATSTVFVAERGRIEQSGQQYRESTRDFIDQVTVLSGGDGKVLGAVKARRPAAIVARSGTLHLLHETADGKGFQVSAVALAGGVPQGAPAPVFTVPPEIRPFDLERDQRGRFYLSDPEANKVHQLSPEGKILRTFGRLPRQKPGAYDPQSFMSPGKLATWTDPEGKDRLIVVEQAGPNRASEWSAESGALLREFQSLQTKANDGYAIDPDRTTDVYVGGHEGWLTRFKVDPAAATWTVDAVWPDVGTDPKLPGFDHPRFIRANGRAYLACARSNSVYRLDGDRWTLCAGIVVEAGKGKRECYAWQDANGNGKVEEEEYRRTPLDLPGSLLRYHGNEWLEDLSLIAINQGGRDVWRLPPAEFDPRGTPRFTAWEKVLTDPVFEARAKGAVDAVHGGNELSDRYSSDWAQVDGSMSEGFFVNARGGRNFSANEGAQTKISRYVPDGRGGYRLLWRVGRQAMQGVAKPGEIYGAIHLRKPINGLLSIVDQSRCGILLFTEAGLYVDTIFPDGRAHPPDKAGLYPQPGEFFAGNVIADRATGKIFFAMGKFTPLLFEAEGWSLRENPVRPLAVEDGKITLPASTIADPPEVALSLRGGAGKARLARFAPAGGGAALDGSLDGWESCEPVRFESDPTQTVEVRCLYDPETLYLRWHARLGRRFEPRELRPVERLFTHDRLADTLSLYIQGDPDARPGGPAGGRPGDVRLVFAVTKDGPAALGLHPKWPGKGVRQTYRTPVGTAEFEHVAPVEGATLGHRIDEDGNGFVLAAAIPRSALPGMPRFSGTLRTLVNFEATFAGHNKFWWANADGSASRETFDEPTEARLYPGSWAPAQFEGLDRGVLIRRWRICGPWGGPGAETFRADLSGADKDRARKFCDAARYPPDDASDDVAAVYRGELLRGYWPDPREASWKPAAVADLDTRVVLGPSAQVWYGAVWVHVPEDLELDFLLQGHPQTFLRFTVGGEQLFSGEVKGKGGAGPPVERKKVLLRKGWTRVGFRGYCVGYPPFRAGLVLEGPSDALWKVKQSASSPGSR